MDKVEASRRPCSDIWKSLDIEVTIQWALSGEKIGKALRFVSAGGMFAAFKPSQDGDFLVATAHTDALYSGPPLAARQSSTIHLASNW